jgi:hypothetical protein
MTLPNELIFKKYKFCRIPTKEEFLKFSDVQIIEWEKSIEEFDEFNENILIHNVDVWENWLSVFSKTCDKKKFKTPWFKNTMKNLGWKEYPGKYNNFKFEGKYYTLSEYLMRVK